MFSLIPVLQPSLEVQRKLFLLESVYASFRMLTDVSPSLKKLAGPPYPVEINRTSCIIFKG